MEFPFTKNIAIENNIDVFQPLNIREDNGWLVDKKPDLIVTCAYGQIIPYTLNTAKKKAHIAL